MPPEKLAQFKDLLDAERRRLERELNTFAKPDPTMRGDWDTVFPAEVTGGSAHASSGAAEEQADIREEFETELAQEQSLETRLLEVTNALERISAGAFGRCRACGEPIPEARLMANPAAEYDMAHQPHE